MPISELNLARYIAYLACRLCYNSVKQYLNIVHLLHLESGLPNPLDSWYLTSLLRGCRRVKGDSKTPKLPITLDLLRLMFKVLKLHVYTDLVFWAVCLTGFFSFLRKSNLLPEAGNQNASCLLRDDVTFLPLGVVLRIRQSKCLQYKERDLCIPIPAIQGSPLCPARALLLLVKLTPTPGHAPLFTYPWHNGYKPYSYQSFMARLKSVLSEVGVNPKDYAGHSLRRGGASCALSCNIPADLIKLQGDWKSDCYQSYLEPDFPTKFTLAAAMAAKVQDSNVPTT